MINSGDFAHHTVDSIYVDEKTSVNFFTTHLLLSKVS